MTSSYPIKIWSGLLSDGHTQKIENALWEFLWLINKVTKEENGIGYVLKGKPVKVNEIADDLKRNYRAVLRHLKKLEEEGYINLKRCPYGFIVTINNSKKFNDRYDKNIQSGVDINVQSGYDKNIQSEQIESVQKCQTECTKMSERYDKNVQNKLRYKTDIKHDNKYIYSRVVNYLNKKASTNYKPTTAKTQELINARLNEGFTPEDFEKVIDNKVTEWTGTEWEKFIRPLTLFGTKFESYLNQKKGNNGSTKKHFENERDYTDDEREQINRKFYGE